MLVFSAGCCVSCAEFTLGSISATGLMDELPQFRAGCRPVQLLVYHRISSGLCWHSLAAGRDPGKATHPTLAQECQKNLGSQWLWVGVQTSCHCLCFYLTTVWVSCRGLCCSCVNHSPEVFTASVETGPIKRAWNAKEGKKEGGVEGRKVWGCTEGSHWHGTLNHQQNTRN